jgi:flavin reductase (DIM6/NTAB) family NADH-FMN oxidoreductase RutF
MTNKNYFSHEDILSMEDRTRAAFINSISGFKSASLIGSINSQKQTNLAIFSSVVHIGSNPALIGFIMRPNTTSRHTYENILEVGYFTINHIHEGIYKQAHQTSARYEREVSEFDATGLTPEYSTIIPAPYVKESTIKYGLQFETKYELPINGTILVIGKVVEIFLPTNIILAHGAIDIEKAGTLAISGLDSYHTTKQLSRLSYAKPNKDVECI